LAWKAITDSKGSSELKPFTISKNALQQRRCTCLDSFRIKPDRVKGIGLVELALSPAMITDHWQKTKSSSLQQVFSKQQLL